MKFLRRIDRSNLLDFAHIESEYAQPLIARHGLKEVDSVVVIDGDSALIRSRAVLKIIRNLRAPYSWLYIGIIIPNFIRDWMYGIIARNRKKWFGRSSEITCDFLVEGGDSKKDKPVSH